ncbi:MAG: DUF721 domain-containing protein [Nitrospirota bacterium]
MGKKIDKLSVTLRVWLKARGLESRLNEYRIFDQWQKTVGEGIARHAQPLSLRGRKLTLIVDSPAWMQQLSLLKPEIIRKVNESLGRETVQQILVKPGEIMPMPVATEAPEMGGELSREEQAAVETCLQRIDDTDVREILRRVIEKDFLNKRLRK